LGGGTLEALSVALSKVKEAASASSWIMEGMKIDSEAAITKLRSRTLGDGYFLFFIVNYQ
jgi:hypothetical protein